MSDIRQALDGIRERDQRVLEHQDRSQYYDMDIEASQADVPKMLAALESVLEYAEDTSGFNDRNNGYDRAVMDFRHDVSKRLKQHLAPPD